jgi:hypothetical protein
MSAIGQIWDKVHAKIVSDKRDPRNPLPIRDENTDSPRKSTDPITLQKDYIQIRVNQLFLSESRRWFTEIEPIVFASTEFLYGANMRTDPFVVGPKKEEMLPRGMILKNTTVCGPHPYRGGPLTFTLVLSRLPVGNIARPLLDLVEAAGKALEPTIGLSAYTKVGRVVIDGFDKLLGLDGVKPLIGFRNTVNPDAGDYFKAGYFALIDMTEPDSSQFWVKNDELFRGPAIETATPFREADFVLFEVTRTPNRQRSDVDRLPLYSLWRNALEAAGKPAPGAWDEAKANLAILATAMALSPDLTWSQRGDLLKDYTAQLIAVHEETLKLSKLAGPYDDGLQSIREQVKDILALT